MGTSIARTSGGREGPKSVKDDQSSQGSNKESAKKRRNEISTKEYPPKHDTSSFNWRTEMNNISFLAVLSLLSSSYAFQHTFLSRSVSSAQGRVAPLHGVISSNDASIASDICNPFGDTVCPPAGDAAGAVEEISKNVIPTPDLSGVAASVGESINSVKLPKAPPLPSNVNVNLDFSTLKPGPQAGEGFEKVRGRGRGVEFLVQF